MNILLTGHKGFLGQNLRPLLDNWAVSLNHEDLRFGPVANKYNIIIHLAARVGGIEYNSKHPASLFYDNVLMNTRLIHYAAKCKTKKLIFISSVCAYPQSVPIPPSGTREHTLWNGRPEASNGTYGLAKRMALAQLEACYQQYGLDYSYLILANMYGPHDHFEDDRSHVIAAMIKRFTAAKDEVTLWGTGTPSRDFLYVKDAARAIVKAIDIESREPINIGSGQETSIAYLANLIAKLVGYKGRIGWDISKPDGQFRRVWCIYRAQDILDWSPQVSLKEGLGETIEWYGRNRLDT